MCMCTLRVCGVHMPRPKANTECLLLLTTFILLFCFILFQTTWPLGLTVSAPSSSSGIVNALSNYGGSKLGTSCLPRKHFAHRAIPEPTLWIFPIYLFSFPNLFCSFISLLSQSDFKRYAARSIV